MSCSSLALSELILSRAAADANGILSATDALLASLASSIASISISAFLASLSFRTMNLSTPLFTSAISSSHGAETTL